MKFEIEKDILEKAMQKLDAIVPARDTQTLLSNVLVSVSKNSVSLTASDFESTVRITIPAENTVAGELIVKAKKLSEIARQMGSEKLTFSAESAEKSESPDSEYEPGFVVKVQGSSKHSARFRMSGNDRSHFPELNNISDSKMSKVPSATLADMIKKTIYAISQEDNRYIYNGLAFHAEGRTLTIVGTDGRRLSAITREIPEPIDFSSVEGDIVVHSKAMKELQRIIDSDSVVNIGVENKEIFFKVGDAELSSRLLEGKFPDYKKVIPETNTISTEIERETLLNAMRQVMVMTEPPSHQIKLVMEDGNIMLMSSMPDVGEAEIQLPVNHSGENLAIGFNALYLMDILRNIDCATIEMKFIDPSKPIVIKDTKDTDFVSLVMPMKI